MAFSTTASASSSRDLRDSPAFHHGHPWKLEVTYRMNADMIGTSLDWFEELKQGCRGEVELAYAESRPYHRHRHLAVVPARSGGACPGDGHPRRTNCRSGQRHSERRSGGSRVGLDDYRRRCRRRDPGGRDGDRPVGHDAASRADRLAHPPVLGGRHDGDVLEGVHTRRSDGVPRSGGSRQRRVDAASRLHDRPRPGQLGQLR